MTLVNLSIFNRKTIDKQYIAMGKRKKLSREAILGLGLALVLALAACTGSSVAATNDTNIPADIAAKTVASGPTVDGGTSFPVSKIAIDGLDADNIVAAQELVLGDIYEASLPSVVHIRISQRLSGDSPDSGFNFFGGRSGDTQERFLRGEGSGFVWDTEGHILTNYHVVEGADTVTVGFSDGEKVEETVLGGDPDSDLAILMIDVPGRDLQPLPQGDSDHLRVGQLALAIGNPFGQDDPQRQQPLFNPSSHSDRCPDQPRQLRRATTGQTGPGDRHQHPDHQPGRRQFRNRLCCSHQYRKASSAGAHSKREVCILMARHQWRNDIC